ncbi:MAG: hypothetical protein KDC38_20855, partial [Planctomycetes bacterium]|nr:hypothetical protein [Planctomycetota bacterium]
VEVDTVTWVLAAEEEIELSSRVGDAWRPLMADVAPCWVELEGGATLRFAYRAKRAEDSPVIDSRRIATQVGATSVVFGELREARVRVNARLVVDVRYTGSDRFLLRLPSDAQLERLTCPNQRSLVERTTAEGLELELTLQSPQRGRTTIDVSWTVPRTKGAPSGVVRGIELLEEVERGGRRPRPIEQYVGWIHTSRAFGIADRGVGISEIERERVPFLPAGIEPRSLGRTYRAQGDWALTLTETLSELIEDLAAVVQLADMVTVIGTDGTVRTRATYSLVNRRLQFFRLELPAGTQLWGVTVDGRSVAVARDGSSGLLRLEIPVERGTSTDLPLEVTCTYAETSWSLPSETVRSGLRAPRVLPDAASGTPVEVTETLWTVHAPDTYRLEELGDRVQLVPHSLKQARKLSHLLGQQQELVERVRYAETKRGKLQATQELQRLDQALGDNLAELESLGRSVGTSAQSKVLAAEELARQWDDNRRLIDLAKRARTTVRDELSAETGAGESLDDLAFRDRSQFLAGGAWRPGAKVEDEGGTVQRPTRGVPVALLTEGRVDPGWRTLGLPAIAP